MPSRRGFLRHAADATAMFIVMPMLTAACVSSSERVVSTSTSATEPACNGVELASTVVEGHTHTVCIATADLTPAATRGITYATSTSNDHSHVVSLSPGQLAAIEAGSSVTVQTSTAIDPVSVASHIHAFTITKAPPP